MSKRKKNRKYRGSKTHGGGSMKKRRGAGSRGGRGRAGSGKRGDARKPSYWKDWKMGKRGFNRPDRGSVSAVNVSDVDKTADSLVADGAAEKKKDTYVIDLSEAGVDKLLGSGQVRSKLDITVSEATDSAVRKVEEAGGSVTLTGDEQE